jgi:hypothetical protein
MDLELRGKGKCGRQDNGDNDNRDNRKLRH